jgi:hypothetical protein
MRLEFGSLSHAAHLGARGVKGKAYCAISVVPTLAQRTRKDRAPRRWLCRRVKPRPPAHQPSRFFWNIEGVFFTASKSEGAPSFPLWETETYLREGWSMRHRPKETPRSCQRGFSAVC